MAASVPAGAPRVVLTWTDDRSDPQYEISRDAYERLMQARDARGRRFKVHKLHQPSPLAMTRQEAEGVDAAEGTQPRDADSRLAASYVNFYLGTKRVVIELEGAQTPDGFSLQDHIGAPHQQFVAQRWRQGVFVDAGSNHQRTE